MELLIEFVHNDTNHYKLWTRVSNGTEQCNFLGQRNRSSFIVPGQRIKLKILPRDKMGRNSLSKSRTGHETGQSLFFCQNPGQDVVWNRTIIICKIAKYAKLKVFWFFGASDFVLGHPGTEEFVPIFLLLPCPWTKRQWDVWSQIVPEHPIP